MAFGYEQARASGMTGFDGPPSTAQMNFHLRWKDQEKRIRALVKQNPSLEPIIRQIIARQTAANCWSVDLIISELWARKLLPQSN
jgi:hypothetical protein